MVLGGPHVTASDNSVAAGRDITAPVTVYNFPPELIDRLQQQVLKQAEELGAAKQDAAVQRERAAEKERLAEDLSRHLDTTTGVIRAALVRAGELLGRDEIPIERLPDVVADMVVRLRELEGRLRALEPADDPRVSDLRRRAAEAVEAGDVTRADEQLTDAEERMVVAARQKHELAAQIQRNAEQDLLGAAARRAERGELALAVRDYRNAADHFQNAANYVSLNLSEVRADYLDRAAQILVIRGEYFADNDALREATGLFRNILSNLSDISSFMQSRVLVNLGNALILLGKHEVCSTYLKEAITVYETASRHNLRSYAPLAWASAQHNLGAAHRILGERETSTKHFTSAVEAYSEALKERNPQSAPFDWALTQNNLGNVLFDIYQRNSNAVEVEDIFRAYNSVFQVWTFEIHPFQWAMVKNNLASAYACIGKNIINKEYLNYSIELYNEVLKIWTRQHYPIDWARVINNIGITLLHIAICDFEPALAKTAITFHRKSLYELKRERVPSEWASTHNNVAAALHFLGYTEPNARRLKQAVITSRKVLSEWTRESAPLLWADTQSNLGNILFELAVLTKNFDILRQAEQAYRQALLETVFLEKAKIQARLGEVLAELGEGNRKMLQEAARILSEACKAFNAYGLEEEEKQSSMVLKAVLREI